MALRHADVCRSAVKTRVRVHFSDDRRYLTLVLESAPGDYGRVGLLGASMHPTLPRFALQGQPAAVQICSRQICRTGGFSPRLSARYENAPVGGDFVSGGESGIRTHGRLTPTAVFKTAALNRSAISPNCHCGRVIRYSGVACSLCYY